MGTLFQPSRFWFCRISLQVSIGSYFIVFACPGQFAGLHLFILLVSNITFCATVVGNHLLFGIVYTWEKLQPKSQEEQLPSCK